MVISFSMHCIIGIYANYLTRKLFMLRCMLQLLLLLSLLKTCIENHHMSGTVWEFMASISINKITLSFIFIKIRITWIYSILKIFYCLGEAEYQCRQGSDLISSFFYPFPETWSITGVQKSVHCIIQLRSPLSILQFLHSTEKHSSTAESTGARDWILAPAWQLTRCVFLEEALHFLQLSI